MPRAFGDVHDLIERAVLTRVAPAAAVEVGRSGGRPWRAAVGHLTYEPGSPAATIDTVFDLASLTKVVATTSLAMQMADAGRLDLDAPVEAFIPGWRASDRASVTLADLLSHASGLPATRPLYETCAGRGDFERAISALPLEYPPRSRSVYSDLGFVLVGFVLEDLGRASLDEQFAALARLVDASPHTLEYRRLVHGHARNGASPGIAPTQVDAWRGRLIQGEVDDRNGAALDGVAGHTGLFGTVTAVGRFARAVLRSWNGRGSVLAEPQTLRRFITRTSVPGSSRALGWDTMLTTSSCGTKMSPEAFGHTGFTGTSLWIDPAADVYVVLLTNRVHPVAGSAEGITALRRAVHDAAMEDLAREPSTRAR